LSNEFIEKVNERLKKSKALFEKDVEDVVVEDNSGNIIYSAKEEVGGE